MNNSIRLLRSLQNRPIPSRIFVRNSSHGDKEPIGGGVQLFPPGPRQLEQMKNWIPAGAGFGAAAFVMMLYFTDWKVVNTYIPFYGGKFKDDE